MIANYFLHKKMKINIHWNIARSKSAKNVRNSKIEKTSVLKNRNVGWKSTPNHANITFPPFSPKNVGWKICSETYFIQHRFFLFFWKVAIFGHFWSCANQANISSNIEKFPCWMKCWHGNFSMLDEMLAWFVPAFRHNWYLQEKVLKIDILTCRLVIIIF